MRLIHKTWLLVFLTSCFTGFPAQAELIDIDNAQLDKLLAENTLIIDVRHAEEWAETGIVPTSLAATFFDKSGRYDAPQWLHNLNLVAHQKTPVILICRTGSRSRVIGQWLSSKVGYETVYNVTSGIQGWAKSGRAIVPVQTQ